VGYRVSSVDPDGPTVVIKVDLPDIAMCVKKGTIIHLMDGAVTIDVRDMSVSIENLRLMRVRSFQKRSLSGDSIQYCA
jgi:hypothetical protein